MISVLLVDDHPVVIEGLRKLLDTAGDIEVTGSAYDASSALTQAKALKPHVILLDLRMPGATGIQTTRRLREQQFQGAIIVLTSYGDQAYVTQALEAGADGYLLKSTPSEQLIAAIREATHGRRQLSPELLDGVLEEIGDLAREKTAREFALSEEEAEILLRTSQGASNRAIATGMDISEVSVKKRLATIYQKLGASDRASAVAVAIRRGLI